MTVTTSEEMPRWVTAGGDCDDDSVEINPEAAEVADGVDNDCDGEIDGDVDGDADGDADVVGGCECGAAAHERPLR